MYPPLSTIVPKKQSANFLEPHNFQKLEMFNKQASITLNQRKLMSQDLSIESFKVLNLEKLTKFSGEAKLNNCRDEYAKRFC